MTHEELIQKEVIKTTDIAEAWGVSVETARKVISDIKSKSDKLELRGAVLKNDYINALNLSTKIEYDGTFADKEVIRAKDLAEAWGISQDTAYKKIREIKAKSDRTKISGMVHLQDYLEVYGE